MFHFQVASGNRSYLEYTAEREERLANGKQTLLIFEGADVNMAMDGNPDQARRLREGGEASGGAAADEDENDGESVVVFTRHLLDDCGSQGIHEMDGDEDQDLSNNTQRAKGKVIVALFPDFALYSQHSKQAHPTTTMKWTRTRTQVVPLLPLQRQWLKEVRTSVSKTQVRPSRLFRRISAFIHPILIGPTPARAWELLKRYPNVTNASKQFTSFVVHQDINELEERLKECLPTTRHGSVDEFLTRMKVWLEGDRMQAPFEEAWTFFNREIAAVARADAVQAQDELL